MKRSILFCVLIASLAVLAMGCSGGGGGSAVSGGSGTAAGTFTKTVALSATLDSNTGILVMNSFRHYQLLYKPADVAGSGYINSISLRLDSASSGATCSNVTIKLGHTDVTGLGTDMASNINQGKGAAATALNNATITVPSGAAGDYFTIPLSTPFNYNGVDNLVVDVTRTIACSGNTTLRTGTGSTPYVARVYSMNSASPDTATESSSNALHMKFNFAGGDDALIYPGVVLSYCAPFCNNAWRHLQTLHLASDINGSGRITGIGMVVAALTANATYTATIKLGHSQQSTLTSASFSNNFDYGAPVTVASNVVFTVPANAPAGTTLWLPITDSYNYDGTHNLIVDIDVSSGSAVDNPWRATSIAGRSLYGTSGSTVGTGISSDAMHTKFRFAGGTMDVITTENNSLTFPYGTVPNKQQFLYRAAELGTKGSISRLAYRLRLDSTTISTYGSFQVVLGHTTYTTLGDTSFSANMTGAQTVYSGTYTIPAGLKAGDWMEIPFSTPFAYDGVSNLVVQTSNLAGVDKNIAAETNAVRYPNRRAYLANNTGDDPSGSDDILADLRLVIQ